MYSVYVRSGLDDSQYLRTLGSIARLYPKCATWLKTLGQSTNALTLAYLSQPADLL